jgi:hypothetical protein
MKAIEVCNKKGVVLWHVVADPVAHIRFGEEYGGMTSAPYDDIEGSEWPVTPETRDRHDEFFYDPHRDYCLGEPEEVIVYHNGPSQIVRGSKGQCRVYKIACPHLERVEQDVYYSRRRRDNGWKTHRPSRYSWKKDNWKSA